MGVDRRRRRRYGGIVRVSGAEPVHGPDPRGGAQAQ